jgi:hypothetical protein
VALADDLERIAAAAAAFGAVTAVLAAEPSPGWRTYLVALGERDAREWLAVDDAGRPVERRDLVRETASIVVMCELAGEVAGGGDLENLRAHLARLRLTERPEGIEDAEEAALALEHVLGAPPRVASPAYLDAVGAATVDLERALGELGSPFANAMKSGAAAVDEFLSEVESRYKLPLDA